VQSAKRIAPDVTYGGLRLAPNPPYELHIRLRQQVQTQVEVN
jgi:hypothetical protein